MKSRISIDVNEKNQPLIKVECRPSEDLRDKMVQRFKEGFGGVSNLCNVVFKGAMSRSSDPHAVDETHLYITPKRVYKAPYFEPTFVEAGKLMGFLKEHTNTYVCNGKTYSDFPFVFEKTNEGKTCGIIAYHKDHLPENLIVFEDKCGEYFATENQDQNGLFK